MRAVAKILLLALALSVVSATQNDWANRGNYDRRQLSYSYGTTAYHYQQQQAAASQGYASAVLTSHQSGQSQPGQGGQASECQHAMLRMFFKHCHPPGSAPQSPVQCQPIPGESRFRCMIKHQSWPIVRISQCPEGTAAASGDCVRIPGGSVMIVPVISTGPRLIQTSSVYRHCANGACQTCIGEECSTTGVQTPVSVDHRGRANSSTEVVAFGDAGRDVKQKCSATFCKTCIDRICYDRSYPLLRVTAGCPPAVCDDNCQDFVYWTDQCPICRCRGFASREPCRSQHECPAGSTCRNQVCIYAELPNTHFDKVCTFSSQCPSDQLCYNWRCGAKPAQSRHLDQSCAMDQDCPSGYICADMSCWQGDASRLRGQDCVLDHQCPAGYFCTSGKCTDVYHHGSFDTFAQATTIPPTTDRQCEHSQQCYGGETCFERRCVTVDEYRRIDEARRRQQIEHQAWQPQQPRQQQPPYYAPAPAPAPVPTTPEPDSEEQDDQQDQRAQEEQGQRGQETQGHESPDDEYQRRLAEYNRQLAERERQYEEQRRQMEEERRRQEEAENQRRRQEQEEVERRRQQEQNDRRQQEQEEQRRRQELEEQRRRQQEEENQRRVREQEEARRRQTEQSRLREEQERAQEEVRRREAEQQARLREQQEEVRRRQQQEEETRRRQEQEATRRELEAAARPGHVEVDPDQHHPEPTPDTEVGEEAAEDSTHDDDAEYERRMQEYNRQLKERQRALQAEHEEEQEPGHNPYPTPADVPMEHHPEMEVHDNEDDFYGRTRQRVVASDDDDDQSVASYRVRYHRVRRRQ